MCCIRDFPLPFLLLSLIKKKIAFVFREWRYKREYKVEDQVCKLSLHPGTIGDTKLSLHPGTIGDTKLFLHPGTIGDT